MFCIQILRSLFVLFPKYLFKQSCANFLCKLENVQDTIYTRLFADDQVLITQEYEHMESMVRTLLEECEKLCLKINLEKLCVLEQKPKI